MEAYTEFEHAGLTVRIYQEEDASFADPRDNDNLGVMFCDHRDYNLGDKDAPDPREAARDSELPFEQAMAQYLKEDHGARVILPLFLYDHSGITMFTGGRLDTGADDFTRTNRYPFDSAGWDTSSIGIIFDTAESRKLCGCEDFTDAQIEESLRGEVAEYDAYLRGDVFCYTVLKSNGFEWEVLDSCGGFIDSEIHNLEKSYTYAEARSAAESCAEQVKAEQAEAAAMAARDIVTVAS